ncbi:MAG: alpha-E domain-containing protein [Gallionellaceae bacterium]|nr:alpha-E domain-containing protein [Gallionellaceae bacterium]MDD5366506.1 alpha-E domain-containing protein [Gallionellaceae bacterium]
MLSRVAESLYWMTRYLERAENTARLINSSTQVLLDLPKGAHFGWDVLISVAGLQDQVKKRGIKLDEASIMRFLIEDEENPSSILSSIQFARENTRTFREVLPMEIWERINGMYLYIRQSAKKATRGRGERYEVLNGVIERRQSIVGLLMGSMSHDIAYQFLKLGRNLERADMTTRIVDVNSAVVLPTDPVLAVPAMERLWMSTLNALSAYQMYRCHVGVHVRAHDVVQFLLKDPHFPRTVHHCLDEIEGCLSVLPSNQEAMRAARHAWRRLDRMNLNGLAPVVLHEYLDQVQADLGAIHDAVSRHYFYLHHTPATASGDNQ